MTTLKTLGSRKRLASAGALAVAFLAILAVGCTPPAADRQDKDWTRSDDLISTSDRIITARFIDSRLETVQQTATIAGVPAGKIDVLFRQFEVVNVYKGTSEREDLIWITFEPGRAGELVDGRGDLQEFHDGPTYVLFLKGRLRPLEYPVEFGAVLWTGNGEPSFARLNGQQLLFMAERPYLSLLEREGSSLPVAPSAAPFELSLADIETATR